MVEFISAYNDEEFVVEVKAEPCFIHIIEGGKHTNYFFSLSVRGAYIEALKHMMPEELEDDYDSYLIKLGYDVSMCDCDIKLDDFLKEQSTSNLRSYLDKAPFNYVVDTNVKMVVKN